MLSKYYKKKNKDLKLNIYAYSPPPQGNYTIDDKIIEMPDYRTVEQYKTYRECGFNTLFIQFTAPYSGEPWETSETKMVMDRAKEAGCDKAILVDKRIFNLAKEDDSIIGEGKKFKNEEELDNFIKDCIKDYKKHPIFYGIQLIDEPPYTKFKAIGEIFRAVKRVDPSIYVQCNILPLTNPTMAFRLYPEDYSKDMYGRYESYLELYLKETQADYIMFDYYPYKKELYNNNIEKNYFRCLQVISRVCRNHNVTLKMVMQSFGMLANMKPWFLLPNKVMMDYQKNIFLAFGIKGYSYFTYWTKQANSIHGEFYKDGNAMMKRDGTKTKLYGWVKKINEEFRKFAPILHDFQYQRSCFVCKPPFFTRPLYMEHIESEAFPEFESATIDREIVMITELLDKAHDQKMYAIVNVTDPMRFRKEYKKEKLPLDALKVQVKFNVNYIKADRYFKGKWQVIDIKDRTYNVELKEGEAVFILPQK